MHETEATNEARATSVPSSKLQEPQGHETTPSVVPAWPIQRPIQTLRRAYADICAGVPPWVALNEFFHEWFDYSQDRRSLLLADPLADPITYPLAPDRPARLSSALASRKRDDRDDTGDTDDAGEELWRWAVFCVAAADYLCERDGVARPAWIEHPAYTLSDPWYGFGLCPALTPASRAVLEQTTPEPLRRRNILGGDRVFANKYEVAKQMREMREMRQGEQHGNRDA